MQPPDQLPLFESPASRRSRRWRLARRAGFQAQGRLVVAGGLIFDGSGGILLIHRSTRQVIQWETPGGKVARGESPQVAAQRELQEELGVRTEVVADLGAHDLVDHGHPMRYALFELRVVEGIPTLRESCFDQWGFFDWTDLAAMREQLSPNARNILDLCRRGRLKVRPIQSGEGKQKDTEQISADR